MNNPFQVIGGEAILEADKSLPLNSRIEALIGSSPIFLFMKGTPDSPMCGFSANVIRILDSLHVSYKTFNILSDDEIREGVKVFSKWPTYPQLYVKGELVGGNDIVSEMLNNGELQELLKL
jgi:monothiol glutaredoxin